MNAMGPPAFRPVLTTDDTMRRAAQRLRYEVFIEELGGQGAGVDHDARLEIDPYDSVCDHLLLIDDTAGRVAGVYRLIRSEHATEIGRFYTESEFDLGPLKASGRKLLELGRSCLHPEYRGGAAMYYLWHGLSEYAAAHDIEVMFGTASFHGTDPAQIAPSLSLLHHRHLTPEALRPVALQPHAVALDQIPADDIDRREAMVEIPALIKAYLRLGGSVGKGAFVDHDFNTIDVCLVLDLAAMNDRQRQIYTSAQ